MTLVYLTRWRQNNVQNVEALIEQYPDVLTSVPGRTDLIQHDIKLSTSEPIRSKGYPVPFKARDVMDSEIKEI